MQYEGIITNILDVEQIGENKTDKRTVILEENSDREYKGGLAFDLWGEKVSLIDAYKVGDIINTSLNVKVREYNGRRYNSISAWKLEGKGSTDTTVPAEKEGDDDLPF